MKNNANITATKVMRIAWLNTLTIPMLTRWRMKSGRSTGSPSERGRKSAGRWRSRLVSIQVAKSNAMTNAAAARLRASDQLARSSACNPPAT